MIILFVGLDPKLVIFPLGSEEDQSLADSPAHTSGADE